MLYLQSDFYQLYPLQIGLGYATVFSNGQLYIWVPAPVVHGVGWLGLAWPGLLAAAGVIFVYEAVAAGCIRQVFWWRAQVVDNQQVRQACAKSLIIKGLKR